MERGASWPGSKLDDRHAFAEKRQYLASFNNLLHVRETVHVVDKLFTDRRAMQMILDFDFSSWLFHSLSFA